MGLNPIQAWFCSGFNITAVLKVEFITANCNDHLYFITMIITGTFNANIKIELLLQFTNTTKTHHLRAILVEVH